MDEIEVIIDAIIFQKPAPGGIARIFQEVLPRMCSIEPKLKITLFSDGPIIQPLPQHPQIKIRSAPKFKRNIKVSGWQKKAIYPFHTIASSFWNRARRKWIGNGEGVIWHSTFYTLPDNWNGYQVVNVHDMILERFPEIFRDRLDNRARSQKKRCILQANAVICNSYTTQNELKTYIDQPIPGKIFVISPACSDIFRPIDIDPRQPIRIYENPFLLYVGKREGYKNFAALLEAYRQWQLRFEIDLVVVGSHWTLDEKAIINKLGVADQIKLIQRVDDQLLCQLYNQALAFVYPSLFEGFGIPLLEAMACGCPIIASHIPSTIEVAGEFPTYFDPHQAGTLAKALNIEMGRGREPSRIDFGSERARFYSWDRAARQILDVYRDLY